MAYLKTLIKRAYFRRNLPAFESFETEFKSVWICSERIHVIVKMPVINCEVAHIQVIEKIVSLGDYIRRNFPELESFGRQFKLVSILLKRIQVIVKLSIFRKVHSCDFSDCLHNAAIVSIIYYCVPCIFIFMCI